MGKEFCIHGSRPSGMPCQFCLNDQSQARSDAGRIAQLERRVAELERRLAAGTDSGEPDGE